MTDITDPNRNPGPVVIRGDDAAKRALARMIAEKSRAFRFRKAVKPDAAPSKLWVGDKERPRIGAYDAVKPAEPQPKPSVGDKEIGANGTSTTVPAKPKARKPPRPTKDSPYVAMPKPGSSGATVVKVGDVAAKKTEMDVKRAMALLKPSPSLIVTYTENDDGWLALVDAYRQWEQAKRKLEDKDSSTNIRQNAQLVVDKLNTLINGSRDWANGHSASDDPGDVERVEAAHIVYEWAATEAVKTSTLWMEKIYVDDVLGSGQFPMQAITDDSVAGVKGGQYEARDYEGVVGKPGKTFKSESGEERHLNEAHRAALRAYTGGDYGYINPASVNSPSWRDKNKAAPGPDQGFVRPRQKGPDPIKVKPQTVRGLERGGQKYDKMTLDEARMEEGVIHAGMIKRAMQELPPYKDDVYRGQVMDQKRFDELKLSTVGAEYRFTSLTSTSRLKSEAQNFIDATVCSETPIGVFYTIQNAEGRHIAMFSKYENEDEVLVSPKTFKIVKSEKLNSRSYRITLSR